jgi:hypothetical protein
MAVRAYLIVLSTAVVGALSVPGEPGGTIATIATRGEGLGRASLGIPLLGARYVPPQPSFATTVPVPGWPGFES